MRKPMTGKWIVQVFGKRGSDNFEISVVREDNEHGRKSWGWFDENKLLITHNGGPCKWPLLSLVWDKQIALAKEVAQELNDLESNC